MTPEELFNKNINLPHWCLKRYFPYCQFDEDMQQEARVGLWKACKTYDPQVGRFTSYAVPCILNSVRMALRKEGMYGKMVTLSLDEEVPGCDGLRYADSIPDPAGGPEESGILILNFVEQLQGRDKLVVELQLQGLKQSQAAEVIGVSQSYYSRLLRNLRKRYKGGN